MSYKIIVILGHPRSGTTLLNRLLSAHPAIHFVSYEFNDLPFFYANQHRYEKYKSSKYRKMMEDLFQHRMLHQPYKYPMPSQTQAITFDHFLREFWEYFHKLTGKIFIGVKIVHHVPENIALIKQFIPDAYCIHIIRDPRDAILSMKKTPNGPTEVSSLFYAAKKWQSDIKSICSIKHTIPKYHELHYEDLIAGPEQTLKYACEFLGSPFDKSMLQFYKKKQVVWAGHDLLNQPIVRSNFGKWEKFFKKKDLDLIYAAAQKGLLDLGYMESGCHVDLGVFKRLEQWFLRNVVSYIKLVFSKRLFIYRNIGFKIKVIVIRCFK